MYINYVNICLLFLVFNARNWKFKGHFRSSSREQKKNQKSIFYKVGIRIHNQRESCYEFCYFENHVLKYSTTNYQDLYDYNLFSYKLTVLKTNKKQIKGNKLTILPLKNEQGTLLRWNIIRCSKSGDHR